MSTGRRVRLSAEERRERIEEAATKLFAERGYRRAGMEEIARRCGVTVPVLYDHFSSKQDLYRRLLERHFADLRSVWFEHLAERPTETAARMAAVVDAWFAYVESHPFAWRMLFRETSGDPDIEAMHAEVAAASRAALLPLVASEPAAAGASPAQIEMLWEVVRGVLQSLALWWYEHREVARGEVVAAAMDGLWLGLERLQRGERWPA